MTSAIQTDAKRMLILGAGPGLSASVARRFGREGFAVTLVARREQSLAELADQLRGGGITVATVTADAADSHGFREVLEDLTHRVVPEVIVYNAAVIAQDGILTSDIEYLLSTYAVDVLGAVTAAQVFAPAMRQSGGGTFLATGGSPSVDPQPVYASLSLGKAALRAAVSLLHDELKGDGVHVAGITICGAITPGTPLDPDRIADTYWAVHREPAAEWSAEYVVDGY